MSDRTIYRDIRDLSISGIPVEGEAGVGYRIDRHFDLTPLMFAYEEVEALVAGLRMVETFAGPGLNRAAKSALSKIALALPPERREDVERPRLFAPSFLANEAVGSRIDTLREAITNRKKLQVTYTSEESQSSSRVLRPLALYFWGANWTLAAWCELRNDFRNFRLDRIETISSLAASFEHEDGKSLDDFLLAMRAGSGKRAR